MLSDSAYDQVKNRSDVGVVRLGRFRLKNVGRPFELYAVSAEGIVVPDPGALEGNGERFASLPSNLPDPPAPVAGLIERCPGLRIVTTSRTLPDDRGRAGVPARPARASPAVRSALDRVAHLVSGDRTVRRAREDDQRLVRAHARERRGRRGGLPAPGRPAARS